MKRIFTIITALTLGLTVWAQGWPSQYGGVMLQGFYWDSYSETRWSALSQQAEDLGKYYDLVWVPQSASCGASQSMGYDDLYWLTNYNSSFGTETQLRDMIGQFKAHGITTIADVVINHRKNVSNWVDFPKEVYKGETYELVSTDICANDDGGATKTWAEANGYSLSQCYDTGEDWSGMRDLDHYSANVQRCVKAYLHMLLDDLGYGGFRYDMVKGYSGSFTGIYNSDAQPRFSVGEYWDGNVTKVVNWLNATKVDGQIQSAAFDFPFRYTVRDAANGKNWAKLASLATLAGKAEYRRYAVTFIENHDTEYRSSTEQQDPLRADTAAANAFMMAMPGTPCVFWKHWVDCRADIRRQIDCRRLIGVTNESEVTFDSSSAAYCSHIVEGANGRLRCVVGSKVTSEWIEGEKDNATWRFVAGGHHWAYFFNRDAAVDFDNLPDWDDDDVTTPEFTPRDITVGVDVSEVGWTGINVWSWGGDGTHSPANTSWPGDKLSETAVKAGHTFYIVKFTISSATDCVSLVFSTGTGSPQTVDISNIDSDAWFVVSSETQSGKHLVRDITASVDAISPVTAEAEEVDSYSLTGRRATAGDRVVISNRKKHLRQ